MPRPFTLAGVRLEAFSIASFHPAVAGVETAHGDPMIQCATHVPMKELQGAHANGDESYRFYQLE